MQFAAGKLLADAAPLLEEERHAGALRSSAARAGGTAISFGQRRVNGTFRQLRHPPVETPTAAD